MTIKVVVGIDISTVHIGYCLQNQETGETLAMGSVNLPSKDYSDIWEKVDDAKVKLVGLYTDWTAAGWEVVDVAVEEPLKNFKPGSSSADVIVKLAQFNAMISFIARNLFGHNPKFINASTARSKIGIKTDRSKKPKGAKKLTSNEKKKFILEQVVKMVDWEWPTKVLKSGPRKGQTDYEEWAYDMMDAFVIASFARRSPV
jgi:hypothetical protein